jgi:predicted ABC-type ATPase
MAQIYLIGGSNGAGKTTSALSLLGQELAGLVFINADMIAAQLNPTAPETAAFQAARIMIEQLEQSMAAEIDFNLGDSKLRSIPAPLPGKRLYGEFALLLA